MATSTSGPAEHQRRGRPRPTMKDVAALAGVGIKTVSRVVNDEPRVAASTIARVRDAAAQLGFQPDEQAGNLRRADGRTRTLGLLISSVSNPFSAAVHRAVEDAATARGMAVFASSLDDDPARERRAVEAFLRRRMDALIMTTAAPSQAYLSQEIERGTPFVFVDRTPIGVTADVVLADNANGTSLATRHLLDHGHSRIAFLGDRADIQTAQERLRGFREELGRAGIPTTDVPVLQGLHDEESARIATRRAFDDDHAPTAILSSQNMVTIGAVRALRELGLQHRIALVGFDDIPLADALEPAVTVIQQDPHRMGELAAELAFARLDGDDRPARTHVVPTRLVVRGSGEIRPQPR